jgi:1-acyl-sn-glycerol-3-phosphate acyltransferase
MLIFATSTLAFWACFELELFCARQKKIKVINKWVHRWAQFNIKVFGVQIEAHGKYLDDGQPYPGGAADQVGRVFVANHRSGMDIPILFNIAETRVISRHDLATWPLLGRAASRVGTLFVDRASRRSGASVLRAVDNALKRGEGVAMFPEGTAYDSDEVHEFRQGAFNAARRAGAEIIPIGLAYDNDTAYYAGQTFLRHMTRIACLRSMRVAVEIGEPLNFDNCTAVQVKDQARAQVQTLVDRARARLNAPRLLANGEGASP